MNIEAPLVLHNEPVLPEWIDYNGHMNLAYYVLIFDHATDAFLDFIGLTAQFRNINKCSTFAAELHVTYEQEVRLGDEVIVKTQLLGFNEKSIHYFHHMYDEKTNELIATNELISLYMDMNSRRVTFMPRSIQDMLTSIFSVHGDLSVPIQVGRRIGLKSRSR